jgi:hypothetical protein
VAEKSQNYMMDLVHVTHEAVQKFGGIGTVLEGLITSPAYAAAVDRTILLCPLFDPSCKMEMRLGPDGEVLYSSIDGHTNHPLAGAFREIQQRFHVEIVYGRRLLREPLTGAFERPEVILIDVRRASHDRVNSFKQRLYDAFGIVSTRYEQSWDFEQYMRLAEPGLAAVRAIGAGTSGQGVIVSHEYMGMPTALAAKLHPECHFKAVFHAHEVSTARKIVEEHSGHDTMFYNVMKRAAARGKYISDIFGDQSGYFRHALVEATRHLDLTLAVGDQVIDELRFLSADMAKSNIQLAYNGIPAYENAAQEAEISKRRLQDYVQNLLGMRPDHVFTHVTRLVTSKGLWRDLSVIHHIDAELARMGRTAAMIVLSTEIGGPRRSEDILEMEKWWDWPVAHREGAPDLSNGESLFHAGVQGLNARTRNCKLIFINQFGFDRASCGLRMPAEMSFWDIRKGSDVEFGQSIYEPFGIAQLEALSFGALCVMSSVCGCASLVQRVAGPKGSPNVIIADYTKYGAASDSVESFLAITRDQREAFDDRVAQQVAHEIIRRLPKNAADKAEFVRRGYELATRMTWDVVAREQFLPAIKALFAKPSAISAA